MSDSSSSTRDVQLDTAIDNSNRQIDSKTPPVISPQLDGGDDTLASDLTPAGSQISLHIICVISMAPGTGFVRAPTMTVEKLLTGREGR